jgi:hypothetical protein
MMVVRKIIKIKMLPELITCFSTGINYGLKDL